MLRLHGVSKSYNHHRHPVTALSGITLEIPDAEFVAVVGPSGSGKSTFLLILGGMLVPSGGRVEFEGRSLYDLDSEQRARLRRDSIGFLFQTFNLMPYLTARENVQVPLFLSGLEEEAQKRKATALLDRVGLGDRLDHKPSELSIGQQQRVALARALANDPTVILADEPTGNLDPDTREQILALLDEVHREGRTVVMVTHDPRAAAKADRTVALVEGTVHA